MVVVPKSPGPLIRRDDLDSLLPDIDDGPGWFDVALVVIGVGLIGWAVAGGPNLVLVLGLIALGLGCILPARSVWHRLHSARGLALRVSDPTLERLVTAYDELVACADPPSIAAAHSALVEVASLLQGRAPESVAEREYASQRTAAIERLTEALRAHPSTDALLLVREELDAISGFNSLTRLEDLAAELRTRRAPD